MAGNPKISIVIANWNGGRFLPNCVQSIVGQSFNDWEVVFVDDGSTDNSVELMRELLPSARIYPLGKNMGFAAAINAGVNNSAGQLVFLLDPDTTLHSDCLASLWSSTLQHPEMSIFTPKILSMQNPEIIDSIGNEVDSWGNAGRIGHGEHDGNKFSQTREVMGGGTAVAYRRDAFVTLGGLDEDFFVFYEDVDLNCRAKRAGFRARFVPEAIVYHFGGGTTKKVSDFVTYLHYRNQLFMIIKCMPFASLVKIFFYHLFWAFKDVLKFVTRIRWSNEVRLRLSARKDALKSFSKMWAKRRAIRRGA